MSDNDLIFRGDVLARKCKYYVYDETGCCREEFAVPVEDIKRLPAAPREMTAREFVKARRRLCEAHLNAITQSVDDFVTRCEGCVLENYCEGSKDNVDGEVAIVEQWAREHPEKRSEE